MPEPMANEIHVAASWTVKIAAAIARVEGWLTTADRLQVDGRIHATTTTTIPGGTVQAKAATRHRIHRLRLTAHGATAARRGKVSGDRTRRIRLRLHHHAVHPGPLVEVEAEAVVVPADPVRDRLEAATNT